MRSYWILGNLFKDEHDRAFRYSAIGLANGRITKTIPKETNRIRPDWCDKCNCYHIIREEPMIVMPKN